MTKSELVDRIADAAGISKSAAGKAVDELVVSITGALKKRDTVAIPGLGGFSVRPRKARKGINPRTGESINIPASNAAAFKPALKLKKALN